LGGRRDGAPGRFGPPLGSAGLNPVTIRSESRLERLLHRGAFCVTAEVVPPRSAGGSAVTAQARALVGYADAVNLTGHPTPAAHMTPVAGGAPGGAPGLQTNVQMTTRDRHP